MYTLFFSFSMLLLNNIVTQYSLCIKKKIQKIQLQIRVTQRDETRENEHKTHGNFIYYIDIKAFGMKENY